MAESANRRLRLLSNLPWWRPLSGASIDSVSESQTKDAEQDENQADDLVFRHRFAEKYLRPQQRPNVAKRNHRVQHRQFAVSNSQKKEERRKEIHRHPRRQVPVRQQRFHPEFQPLRSALQ